MGVKVGVRGRSESREREWGVKVEIERGRSERGERERVGREGEE